ncbi:MAG: response regulator [Candidatus Dormibacteraeota bacterium]|nr:response regulator [Candidatus Dormibacteraeota bacterium]MBO0761516.1 response regulator [Candidatus Dormibacteraeota bacterium]
MEQLRRDNSAGDGNLVLVEDDAAYAEIYKFRLEQDGYRVALAADGRSGLELIRETRPDLVYLDIRLPEMTGIEVLHSLRGDPATADLPVVVLSNYDEAQLREEGFQLGVLEWLVKAHVTPADLAERTGRWLRTAAETELTAEASPPGGC